jgi:hypothetical protein
MANSTRGGGCSDFDLRETLIAFSSAPVVGQSTHFREPGGTLNLYNAERTPDCVSRYSRWCMSHTKQVEVKARSQS